MGQIYGIKKKDIDRIVYIGQTIRNYKIRWQQHKQQAKERHYALYNAFNKYGIDQFFPVLIEECDNDLLNEREQYWIAFYETTIDKYGYNLTIGGDNNSQRIKKPVYQYSLEGNFIKGYESLFEAQLAMTPEFIGSSVFKAAHGIINTAYGFYWSFEKKDHVDIKPQMKTRTIYQYDNSLNLINSYPSIHQAAMSLNKPTGSSNILRAANGKTKKAYGYIWKFQPI